MNEKKELVKETKWVKVYRIGGKALSYESKCLTEGLHISAASIKSTWATLTPEEQLEFTIAFAPGLKLSAEDEEILNFLMEVGSEPVLGNLASLYARHSDRERVLPFLLSRINPLEKRCGNYYQALELLKDPRAIPPLRRVYGGYRRALEERELKPRELFNYLQCCRALWVLDGSAEFENALRAMLVHSNEDVLRRAGQLLSPTGEGR